MLTINFTEDVYDILEKKLKESGFKLKQEYDRKDGLYYYLNSFRLTPYPTPRAIKYSEGFMCPLEFMKGLEELEQKIIKGDSLRPHTSRDNKYYDNEDGMLNAWGIYHFHLGTNLKKNGFVNSTKMLLYAYFDCEVAYFIAIAGHRKWTKKEMLVIIDNNWPHLTDPFRMTGDFSACNISSEEYAFFRKKNINIPYKINDKILYGTGYGYMMNGRSVETYLNTIKLNRLIKSISKAMYSYYEEGAFKRLGLLESVHLKLSELSFDNDKIEILFDEVYSKQKILFIEEGDKASVQLLGKKF